MTPWYSLRVTVQQQLLFSSTGVITAHKYHHTNMQYLANSTSEVKLRIICIVPNLPSQETTCTSLKL